MKGEKQAWYRLASHLGQSVFRTKLETGSREFVEWNVFLDQEERRKWSTQTPEHHYLAQIAKEVRSVLAKKPGEILTKHFLLKFMTEDEKNKEDLLEARKKQAEESKKAWMGWLFGKKAKVDTNIPVSDKKSMR